MGKSGILKVEAPTLKNKQASFFSTIATNSHSASKFILADRSGVQLNAKRDENV